MGSFVGSRHTALVHDDPDLRPVMPARHEAPRRRVRLSRAALSRAVLSRAAQAGLSLALLAPLLLSALPYRMPGVAPESAVAAPGTRAMWVWTAAAPADVVAWARAHGVTTVFAYVDRAPAAADTSRLQDLRRRCDDAGIVLDALGGDPSWVTDHATAVAWRRTVDRLGIFHGVHLDVEPYLLPTWTTQQATLVSGFLTLLDQLREDDSPIEADVPFWYETVPVGSDNLADAVLDRVDALTVMSYRDTATGSNSTMAVSADLLRRAATAAKPLRLGAETQALPDCAHCSFHGDSAAQFRTALAQVDTAARRFPSFAGIAVHDYLTWRSMT